MFILFLVYCDSVLIGNSKPSLDKKRWASGILYRFAAFAGSYDPKHFEEIAPKLPYPIELVTSGIFYTTPQKTKVVEQLGLKNIRYYQTLVNSPAYTNDEVEELVEGYDKGGYAAIIAQK